MSEFEKVHVIHGSRQFLKTFLGKQLQPWRWDIMLKNGGIRAERAGTPIPKLGLNTILKEGDVVFIDDAYGLTWMELRKKASTDFRDLVFCPQRTRDTFLTNQVNALLADKTAIDVPLTVLYIKDLVAQLTTLGKFPIRHIFFVTHASNEGDIVMKIRKQKDNFDREAYLAWEGLTEAIDNESLRMDNAPNPTVTPRPELSGGKQVPCVLIIRGCSAGIHAILLNKIRDAFGPLINMVLMPKFYDAADFIDRRSPTVYAASVEYFMHRFLVTSKTPLDRAGIIAGFKAAKITDWLGNKVPDGDWEGLVPANIANQARTKELSMNIEGRKKPGTFHAHFDPTPWGPPTVVMEQETEPTAQEIQDFVLKYLNTIPMFASTTWPYYKRMGLKSFDEFKAFWTYEVDPTVKKKKGKWSVRAIRYVYEIRTPLVIKGKMVCHYRPRGEKGTESNNIDYNDPRLFGRVNRVPPDFAQKI